MTRLVMLDPFGHALAADAAGGVGGGGGQAPGVMREGARCPVTAAEGGEAAAAVVGTLFDPKPQSLTPFSGSDPIFWFLTPFSGSIFWFQSLTPFSGSPSLFYYIHQTKFLSLIFVDNDYFILILGIFERHF